ncbi:MAG: hypothetical protein DWH97_11820 [Planctomycetota bacterium]|nr:MAG: hypothetical protein DWH97_11820 [Planctomycetota bacterium]
MRASRKPKNIMMPHPRKHTDRVDIAALRGDESAAANTPAPSAREEPKPFLMIWFRCCSVYARLPKSADGTAYQGRCPKCRAQLRVGVGEGGTSRRMFEAQ